MGQTSVRSDGDSGVSTVVLQVRDASGLLAEYIKDMSDGIVSEKTFGYIYVGSPTTVYALSAASTTCGIAYATGTISLEQVASF